MKIFIGSSSRNEIDDQYLKEADALSKALSKETLVFGAGSTSMMGRCYDNFDKVIGFTTKKWQDDIKNLDKATVKVEDSTFDRLKAIYKESDLFIIMPGGIGSLSELLGLLEENRDSGLNKKIIVYNYAGFYDKLLDLIEDMKNKGFVRETDFNNMHIYDNICDIKGEVYGKTN